MWRKIGTLEVLWILLVTLHHLRRQHSGLPLSLQTPVTPAEPS
jgi:hypothetical protein